LKTRLTPQPYQAAHGGIRVGSRIRKCAEFVQVAGDLLIHGAMDLAGVLLYRKTGHLG